MTSQDLFEGIQAVFQTVFEEPALQITPTMTAEDVEGWDSFAHINLIMALEIKFGVKFRLAELQELNCVGDMIDLIGTKVGVTA
jgi:acyl carrier protein